MNNFPSRTPEPHYKLQWAVKHYTWYLAKRRGAVSHNEMVDARKAIAEEDICINVVNPKEFS